MVKKISNWIGTFIIFIKIHIHFWEGGFLISNIFLCELNWVNQMNIGQFTVLFQYGIFYVFLLRKNEEMSTNTVGL